ncbi:MAG: CDP-glucose 4,6-dehydratase [Pseudomonadota bacterium]
MTNFWFGKSVLITGHTGFKGSWLALWMHQLGAKVLGYSLKAEEQSLFNRANLEALISTVYGDVRDAEAFKRVVDNFQPDIIFHLAAQSLVRPSYDDPVKTYSTNVIGTVNVLEAVRLAGGVRVCQIITTDKCYENDAAHVGAYIETDRLGGYDPYSSSKACAEIITSAYRRSFFSTLATINNAPGVSSIASVRAGNVIGGGDYALDRIVPDCVTALTHGNTIMLRHPHAIRPWQYVLEPLSGYIMLAEKQWEEPQKYAEAWNFGPSAASEISVQHLVEKVITYWGSGAWQSVSIVPENEKIKYEAAQLRLNMQKATSRLNWHSRYNIEETIEQTVLWYKKAKLCTNSDQVLALCFEHLNHYLEHNV